MIRIKTFKHITALFVLTIIIHALFATSIVASMDPTEIKKRNSEAPFHIIGEVIEDEMIKDLSEEKDHPYQLRKMTIAIDEVIISEDSDARATTVEVFYSYHPSWIVGEGGKAMDITINDVIEIWLDKGEYGWEPVLSGNSVEPIKYIDKRNEPIPEPFFHYLERTMATNIQYNLSRVVMIGIAFSILVMFFIGFRKR